jgi:hypothetical protein
LALLVILALIALINILVWWGSRAEAQLLAESSGTGPSSGCSPALLRIRVHRAPGGRQLGLARGSSSSRSISWRTVARTVPNARLSPSGWRPLDRHRPDEIYRLHNEDAFRQGLWIVVGVALFAAALLGLRRDYRILEQYKYLFGIGAIVLLFLPRVPGLGTTVNGARLWVHFGSFRFQPGEFAKIFLIVFLAAYLRENRELLAQARLKVVSRYLLIHGRMHARVRRRTTSARGSTSGSSSRYPRDRAARSCSPAWLFLAGGWSPRRDAPVRALSSLDRGRHTGCIARRRRARATQDCQSYQLVKSLFDRQRQRLRWSRARQGTFTTTDGHQLIPFVNSDFIYSALARSSVSSAPRLCSSSSCSSSHAAKIALQADDGFSKLLATGLTFGFALQTFIIVGGVLQILDGDHATFRLVRGLVGRRELSCSPASSSSRTAPTPNEPADLAHRARRPAAPRVADRRDDVLNVGASQ